MRCSWSMMRLQGEFNGFDGERLFTFQCETFFNGLKAREVLNHVPKFETIQMTLTVFFKTIFVGKTIFFNTKV